MDMKKGLKGLALSVALILVCNSSCGFQFLPSEGCNKVRTEIDTTHDMGTQSKDVGICTIVYTNTNNIEDLHTIETKVEVNTVKIDNFRDSFEEFKKDFKSSKQSTEDRLIRMESILVTLAEGPDKK